MSVAPVHELILVCPCLFRRWRLLKAHGVGILSRMVPRQSSLGSQVGADTCPSKLEHAGHCFEIPVKGGCGQRVPPS
eukprot:3157888-Prymnesium_polylepis.1